MTLRTRTIRTMTLKTIPTLSAALTALALTGGVALAQQSMFQQMPTIPDEAPAGSAAPGASGTASSAPAPAQPSIALSAPPPTVAPAETLGRQADCSAIQKTLAERKALVAKANTASTSKVKMTPQQACSLFGQLQANGAAGVKWITANKEWCSIPDSFAEGFKADNVRVAGIRTKVCGMAAQATKMEAQARESGGQGGLLGGPGLTGTMKMPQGAL